MPLLPDDIESVQANRYVGATEFPAQEHERIVAGRQVRSRYRGSVETVLIWRERLDPINHT